MGKDTYFRSVIPFIDRIKDLAATKGHASVKANLSTALRGTALLWYTTELSDLKKIGLRASDNVDE